MSIVSGTDRADHLRAARSSCLCCDLCLPPERGRGVGSQPFV